MPKKAKNNKFNMDVLKNKESKAKSIENMPFKFTPKLN